MSLSVYLEANEPVSKPVGSGIFIRWRGSTREVSREVWDELNPGQDPVIGLREDEESGHESNRNEIYHANITHNLGQMAKAAGIYHVLWRPEEIGITTAGQLIELLREGLTKLEADPEKYEKFNASNGWGLYENFVPFVRKYLEACEKYPEATVHVSR